MRTGTDGNVIIEAADVPDAVLDAWRPEGHEGGFSMESAMARALTAWEAARGTAVPVTGTVMAGHEHDWMVRLCQPQKAAIPLTYVLLRCAVCGDVRSRILAGSWDQADLAGHFTSALTRDRARG